MIRKKNLKNRNIQSSKYLKPRELNNNNSNNNRSNKKGNSGKKISASCISTKSIISKPKCPTYSSRNKFKTSLATTKEKNLPSKRMFSMEKHASKTERKVYPTSEKEESLIMSLNLVE